MRQLPLSVAVIVAAVGAPIPPVAFLVHVELECRLRPRSHGGSAGLAPTSVWSPDETLMGVFKCLT